MASGVAVEDECKIAFEELKIGHKWRYIIYALTDDLKKIAVVSKKDPSGTYEDFVEELKAAEEKGECRFAMLDFPVKDKTKILFFHWSPEGSKIKQKMVYASSKEALKKSLGNAGFKEIQANDHSDLVREDIESNLVKADRAL